MNVKILKLLEKDARMSAAEIAAITRLSEDEVKREISEMEKDGIIRFYQDQLDPKAAQHLAVKYPVCQVKVMLGQYPHLVLKMKKGERNTEFIIELLKCFLSAKG